MPPSIEELPADARQVFILVNPKAGARSGMAKVEALAARLRERQFTAEIVTDPARLEDVAGEALAAGCLRAVVAAGGDGTAALAINRTPIGAPIAVLPLGTENLLAKYLGVLEPAAVCDTIERGAAARLDVGKVSTGDGKSQLFLLMLSCGFDAYVVERLHAGRRGNIRHWSYAKPILHSLRTYEYPELRMSANSAGPDSLADVSARWVFVMNLPCYARGLPIAPDASGHDGLFDVCTFRSGSWWNGLRYLKEILLGRHHQHAECVAFRASRFRIESDGLTPFQIDGDPGGVLPIDVELLPQRWTLLAPRSWTDSAPDSGADDCPDRGTEIAR